MNTDVSVIIVGRAATALGVKRQVANLGFTTYGACPEDSWGAHTRFHRPLPMTSCGRWDGELGEAGRAHLDALPFRRAILIPTADDAAHWMAELPPEIRSRFLACIPSLAAFDTLQDKSKFAALCRRLEVPVPRSFIVKTEDDIAALPYDSGMNLFFKPYDSQSFSRAFDMKGMRIYDHESALRLWREYDLENIGVLVQEYLPGAASDHYFIDGFVDAGGVVRARLARRRLRIYPVDFGNSSSCVSVSIAEVEPAWPALARILTDCDYRGIFSAEFKKDARDGVFRLLEINTRPWLYVEFAGVCGINVCEMYLRDALGEPVSTQENAKLGEFCVDLKADIRAIREMPRAERPPVFATLRQWLFGFKLVFSLRDLKADWYLFLDFLSRLWSRTRGSRGSA